MQCIYVAFIITGTRAHKRNLKTLVFHTHILKKGDRMEAVSTPEETLREKLKALNKLECHNELNK